MKILITGIHGFVGTNLVKALSDENEIYGLDIVSPEKEGVVKTFSWEDLEKGVQEFKVQEFKSSKVQGEDENGNPDLEDIRKTLHSLRLTRFAEAMMWILNKVLGLEEKYLICGMNEKEGCFVLAEILETGNFGRGDKRFKGMSKFHRMAKHGIHLLLHYPSEVIWTPIWLIYHKVWKWDKKRKMKR